MSLEHIDSLIQLDVYNYDQSVKSLKTIAYDKQTRFVNAKIYDKGIEYDIDDESTVTLMIIRPDRVGVLLEGSLAEYDRDYGADGTVTGLHVELSQAALSVQGTIRAQFKIECGTGDAYQILRTEIFTIKNGEALDSSTSDWSGTYRGVPLDELIEQLEDINSNLAPLYNPESTYAVGDYAMHDNQLYKCTTAISTAEDWNVSHWERCSVMSELMPNINFEQVSF